MTGLIIVFVLLSLVIAAVCAPMFAKAREVPRSDGTDVVNGDAPVPEPTEGETQTETPTTTDPAPETGRTLEQAEKEIAALKEHLSQSDATVEHQAQMLINQHERVTELEASEKNLSGFLNDAGAKISNLENQLALSKLEVTVSAVQKAPEGEIPGCVKGRVVYYTPTEHEHFTVDEEDPTIVGTLVKVWDKNTGCANIHLTPDGDNQNPQGIRPWVTSRLFDADGKPGTWRFTR